MTSGHSRSATALVLGGALAAALAMPSTARADELSIGFIAPMTGIFAQVGKDMVNGFQMYLDEHGGKLGGMDVKFIVEDDQAKPDAGVTKAKKLVLQDHVQMFIGGVLASTGYALAPVSTAEKTIYIASIPAADDLTQRMANQFPYFIRTGWSSSQPNHPYGQWACDQGYKKITIVAADYAFGYEQAGGFQKTFEDCGGKIVQKIWPPLGNKDFGPYIPTIKADADAVFSLMVGPMAAQFPKQLRAAGYKKPILGGGTSYDEFALPFMGDEVVGDVSALQYSAALDDAEERSLREGLSRQVRQGAVLFLGVELYHRAGDRRRDAADQRQVDELGGLHQTIHRAETRRGARSGLVRRAAQPGAEHLHQESREEDDVRLRQTRALEHGDQDLSERQPVLDLREGEIPRAAGL